MYFYTKDNRMFIGDNFIPKNTIGGKYYESDTKIEIYDNRSRKHYFKGLITELIKESDVAYVDKADLEAALPDFFFSVAGLGYKSYVAILNQSGTGAPVATIINNDIGSIVWSRNSAGSYTATLTDAFVLDKTVCFISVGNDIFGENICFRIFPKHASQISIYTQQSDGTPVDDRIIKSSLEIRVYD